MFFFISFQRVFLALQLFINSFIFPLLAADKKDTQWGVSEYCCRMGRRIGSGHTHPAVGLNPGCTDQAPRNYT